MLSTPGSIPQSAPTPSRTRDNAVTSASPQPTGTDGSPVVQAAQPEPPHGPAPRRLFVVAVLAAVIALGFTLSFGYADHAPRPHDVKLAVAAPAAVSAQLAKGLQQAEPGGFKLIAVSSARAAIHSVRSQRAAGALIVPASGANTIVTAGAEGTLQQQVLTKALGAASTAMHRPIRSLDAAPLSPGDHSGLSSFVFGLGLLIPSVLGSLGLFLMGMRLRVWWRVAAGALFALLAAAAGVLALDTILGAFTSGSTMELIGIGFLGALSYVLFVAALQAVVGLPGTGLAAVAFVLVGNAVSGGSVPIAFLPDVFRQVAPWLPNSAIVSGARDVVYFNGHDLGHALLVLGLWPTVALAVLALVDLLHGAERRRLARPAHEIYPIPAVVHLARRRQARTV
jgi:hypothetical protein